MMSSKIKDVVNRKRVSLFAVITCVVLYSVYCFILKPIYISSLYDVAYDGSILPDILDFVGKTLEVIAVSVCYACAAFNVYSAGKITFSGTFGVYLVSCVYKYAANMVVGWVSGSGPALILLDVFYALLFVALEVIPFAIACAIFKDLFNRHADRQKILVKAGKEETVYPFKKLYDKKNPLMTSALVSAIALVVPMLIGKVAKDAIEIVEITAPALMIVSYLLNVVFGILVYITVLLTFVLFFERISKK